MSCLGASRYGIDPAPGGLAVVHELLNTVSAGPALLPDLLDDTELAAEWIGEVRRSVVGGHGFDANGAMTAADLRTLRSLREAVTASVTADPTGWPPKTVRADVTLAIQPDGRVGAVPSDRPVTWLVATVMMESLLAQASGDWRRLKICANPDCDVSFYDRSKNRSGVWHDVHVCGNAINLRASRSRRRQAARAES